MAHFAELDSNNTVLRVIVVNNNDILDSSGQESEEVGINFCKGLFGGEWKQTSYNANFRKNYAGIGYTYDGVLDAFIPPQPYPSWILNQSTCLWEAPVPMPTDGQLYGWDEATQSWVVIAPPAE